jgi:5-methylcytosine-specific restriction endonuclease McrA
VSEQTKKCSKCGEVKVADSEFFYKDSVKQDGFRTECKACSKLAALKKKAMLEATRPPLPDGFAKKCSTCKEQLAAEMFGKNARSADGLKTSCKPCRRAKAVKYRAENKEKTSEYFKRYREENPDKRKATCARYRANNRAKLAKYNKRYSRENPHIAVNAQIRRRALKNKASGTYTHDDWQARLAYHENRCAYCGCGGKMTIDHMIPLSRGGTNWPSNLVPACHSCNSGKCDKTPIEFADYTFKQLQAMLGK